MKYFTYQKEGQREPQMLGSASFTKKFLAAHPEIQMVERWHWVGTDLVDVAEYSREEMLGKPVKKLEAGATIQWSYQHGRLSR